MVDLFAQTPPDLTSQYPTTLMGVVIALLMSFVGLLIWVIKWLFQHLSEAQKNQIVMADRVKDMNAAIDKNTLQISELRRDRE